MYNPNNIRLMEIICFERKAFEEFAMKIERFIRLVGRYHQERYRITVSDNGKGMRPEELARITEAFYRVDKARARTSGGAGLGLAICSLIVEAHRGTLSFESEAGRGTDVTVSIGGGKDEE